MVSFWSISSQSPWDITDLTTKSVDSLAQSLPGLWLLVVASALAVTPMQSPLMSKEATEVPFWKKNWLPPRADLVARPAASSKSAML